MDEPKKRGAVVRDKRGFMWRRGTRLWRPLAPEGGEPFRLPWSALRDHFGPLGVDAETERREKQHG